MSSKRISPQLWALCALLAAECALVAAATVYLIVELLVATPDSYESAIALTVLAAIAAVWLGFITVNAFRGRPWIRGAAIVWQVLQIAVAVGAFQGAFSQPDVGWLLLLPSIAVIVLLFTKPVLAATTRRETSE
ncbi:MAG: hypothetical protein JWQ43_1021 [Glaciihabitans sp.]|nr:hypothetical protein [Glaciihabitans sp.]